MASTTALFTGLTGLDVHARRLDVIGNNIANVSTTAFKSSRMLFESLLARTQSIGSAPGTTTGGTNPTQIGMGVGIAGVQRNFASGVPAATGDLRDLAIDGNGFFIVQRNGQTFYTRAGAFRQDLNDNLVTPSGETLQGYGVDENFNILEGGLVDINIPIGRVSIAQASTETTLAGNLYAGGDLPSQGSAINILGTATTGLSDTSGNFIDTTTLLTDIEDPDLPGSGTPLFAVGQTIEISGENARATKGGRTLPSETLEIDAGTTVQDLMDFIDAALGIQDTGANPDGNTPGVTVDNTTGIITIIGNTGTVNDLDLGSSDLRVLDSSGAVIRVPFITDKTAEADGESVRTTMLAYNSLGGEVTLQATFVLDSKGTTGGTTWRYYIESDDDSDVNLDVATGTVDFDAFGQLVDNTPISVTIDLDNTGALSPLALEIPLDSDSGRLTALDDEPSLINNVARNGLPPGTLETFGIQPDGTIVGGFSNGASRTLGRVVMAAFSNPEGLLDAGNNNYVVGPNSGVAQVAIAGTFGTGQIISGALEQSNVDLGKEFTDLILVQTGYSASARIIRTTDELMQQLLVLGR
ncbi:MAG: flagellar hook-basal body complex protein [Phycisphaerales bacterium]